MANEAVLRNKLADAVDFTCSDSVGIEKGELLALYDARTVSGCTGTASVLAGIAAREKIANDGRTQIAVYQQGIFDMYISGNVVVGQPAMHSLAPATYRNYVASGAAAVSSGAACLGYFLETGTNGQQVQVKVRL